MLRCSLCAFTTGSVLACLIACGPSNENAHGAPDSIPPVRGALLIVVDTLRADHVGAYGSGRDLTPQMDALASDALVFRNGVAASSWTRSSMASIFTSQYPTAINVLGRTDTLSDDLETLAETLTSSGVVTLAVSTNRNAGAAFGFRQGFERFEHRFKLPRRGYPGGAQMVPAEGVTEAALRLLDEVPPGQPFFLFAHYIDPHEPYLEHPGLLAEPEPPGRFNGSTAELKQLDALPPRERTRADVARIRHLYAGEVKYCDVWLGALVDGLRERELLDDMLVVLTSDHGEGLWDHGRRGHARDLYEEMIQVPFIVRFPGAAAIQPARIEGFVSHIDIAPTILGAFGLAIPGEYQGRDLGLVARRGELDRLGEFAYSEIEYARVSFESVSDGEQKLIRNRSNDQRAKPVQYVVQEGDTLAKLAERLIGYPSPETAILDANPGLEEPGTPPDRIVIEPGTVLNMPPRRRRKADDDLFEWFRLATDPREKLDLSHTPLGETTLLRDVLNRFAEDNRARQVEGTQISLDDLDEETRAELKALGYLDD